MIESQRKHFLDISAAASYRTEADWDLNVEMWHFHSTGSQFKNTIFTTLMCDHACVCLA